MKEISAFSIAFFPREYTFPCAGFNKWWFRFSSLVQFVLHLQRVSRTLSRWGKVRASFAGWSAVHIASGWIKAETEETCAERMKESSSRNDCFIAYFFPWYFLPCSFTDDDPHKKKVYLELSSSGGLMQFAASIRPSWISRMWAMPDTLQVGNLRSNWETSCVEDLSAPHKRRIPELKENCAHVIPGPIEHSQGIVGMLWRTYEFNKWINKHVH